MLVLPNCVLLDVVTSEDGLKHWYQHHMYKYENPKYTLQYIVIIVILIFLNKINSYIQCVQGNK